MSKQIAIITDRFDLTIIRYLDLAVIKYRSNVAASIKNDEHVITICEIVTNSTEYDILLYLNFFLILAKFYITNFTRKF